MNKKIKKIIYTLCATALMSTTISGIVANAYNDYFEFNLGRGESAFSVSAQKTSSNSTYNDFADIYTTSGFESTFYYRVYNDAKTTALTDSYSLENRVCAYYYDNVTCNDYYRIKCNAGYYGAYVGGEWKP